MCGLWAFFKIEALGARQQGRFAYNLSHSPFASLELLCLGDVRLVSQLLDANEGWRIMAGMEVSA